MDVLDGYRVGALLREGAFIRRHEAESPTGRPVEIRLVHVPETLPRRASEAMAAALSELEAIEHPHVGRILDYGVDPPAPYIVVQPAGGASLAELMAEGPLSADEVALIGGDVAQALEATHRLDPALVHGALTPDSAHVGADGSTRLLDHGLASLWTALSSGQSQVVSVESCAFASPEAVDRKPLGPAADLFSLGAILYTALAGRRPFEGPTALAVMLKIRMGACPKLLELSPDTPPALAELVHGLLATAPTSRPSATEVIEALEAVAPNARRLRPSLGARVPAAPDVGPDYTSPSVELPIPSQEAFAAMLEERTEDHVGALHERVESERQALRASKPRADFLDERPVERTEQISVSVPLASRRARPVYEKTALLEVPDAAPGGFDEDEPTADTLPPNPFDETLEPTVDTLPPSPFGPALGPDAIPAAAPLPKGLSVRPRSKAFERVEKTQVLEAPPEAPPSSPIDENEGRETLPSFPDGVDPFDDATTIPPPAPDEGGAPIRATQPAPPPTQLPRSRFDHPPAEVEGWPVSVYVGIGAGGFVAIVLAAALAAWLVS